MAPDRPLAAVAGRYGEIRLVNTQTGRVLARLEDPHQDAPYFMTFSPDGTRLVVVSHEGVCVHVWDLRAIRSQLARLGLDWEGPAYPLAPALAKPLRVEVKLGLFAFMELGQQMRTSLKASGVGDWWRSIAEAFRAMTNNPTTTEGHFQRGKILFDKRADKEALDAFTRTLTSDPNHIEAYHYRGHLHERRGHFDKARDDFTEALQRRPKDVHFHARRGLAHWRLHDYDKARADLERGRSSKSDEAAVAHAFAWLHVFGPAAMRDAKQAVAEAERAVGLAPAVAEYRDTLGAAYYRAGNHAKAFDTLIHKTDPKRTPTAINRFFLAMSHQQLGEPTKAQSSFQEALTWWKTQTNLPQPQLQLLNALRTETESMLKGR